MAKELAKDAAASVKRTSTSGFEGICPDLVPGGLRCGGFVTGEV
jgi:hypothetical protein